MKTLRTSPPSTSPSAPAPQPPPQPTHLESSVAFAPESNTAHGKDMTTGTTPAPQTHHIEIPSEDGDFIFPFTRHCPVHPLTLEIFTHRGAGWAQVRRQFRPTRQVPVQEASPEPWRRHHRQGRPLPTPESVEPKSEPDQTRTNCHRTSANSGHQPPGRAAPPPSRSKFQSTRRRKISRIP